MEPLALPHLEWISSVYFIDGLSEWLPSVWLDFPSNRDNLGQVVGIEDS
jgi:hypothetical protein